MRLENVIAALRSGNLDALWGVRALSVRQPWAWLIVNGHKDVENRDWATGRRGPTLVHAAKGMSLDEYEEARSFVEWADRRIALPKPWELDRGGVVGAVSIANCVSVSVSPWFTGRYGFELEGGAASPLVPARGMLGFFCPDFSAVSPAVGECQGEICLDD